MESNRLISIEEFYRRKWSHKALRHRIVDASNHNESSASTVLLPMRLASSLPQDLFNIALICNTNLAVAAPSSWFLKLSEVGGREYCCKYHLSGEHRCATKLEIISCPLGCVLRNDNLLLHRSRVYIINFVICGSRHVLIVSKRWFSKARSLLFVIRVASANDDDILSASLPRQVLNVCACALPLLPWSCQLCLVRALLVELLAVQIEARMSKC